MNPNNRAVIVGVLEDIQIQLSKCFEHLLESSDLDGFDPVSVLNVNLPSLADRLSDAVREAKVEQ